MKIKDLMIGDWVYDEYQKPNRVTGYYMHSNTANLLIPIPLTEDILKANEHNDPNYGIVKFVDGHIYIRGWLGNCELYFGMIKYVHELQHALRLCGMNELADNFKLE